MDPLLIKVGYVVLVNGDPVKTASTNPRNKGSKLYSKRGNAKAVAKQYGGVVYEAFVKPTLEDAINSGDLPG